ncbi:MAG: hypothetical protein ACSHW0_19335 [Thalassotalea sp.]
MKDSNSSVIDQNTIRPVFRFLTGAMCALGLYGINLIIFTLYTVISGGSFNPSILIPASIGVVAFILWSIFFGYITIKGRLPAKYNLAKSKNT